MTHREATPASSLSRRLTDLFRSSESLPPDERARMLADWIMEQTDASRCALIPFAGDSPGPPLAFPRRGGKSGDGDARAVPRRIVDEVARTRQPFMSDDVAASGRFDGAESTVRQQVGSFLAAPVIFRGELLAVCYVDRFRQKGAFSEEAQTVFQALAYELARPLITLLDAQRSREYQALRDRLLVAGRPTLPISSSPALGPVIAQVRQLARFSDLNLLILGETGVGKEVVARLSHEASECRGRFVAVNLGALPTELFESELLGSVRGAFTGAEDRPGRAVEAENGTLFLDEIGDLALTNQVKLLRFIEDKRVSPIGGRGDRLLNLRIVAASNRPIESMVARGEFRADLLHRFAPPIRVPPLRDRREEILPHATAWLATKADQRGIACPELTTAATRLLESHLWPGNVRQLEMVLSHVLAICAGGRIDGADLTAILGPPSVAGHRLVVQLPGGGGAVAADPPATDQTVVGAPPSWRQWLESSARREREWLLAALAAGDGNASAASRLAGCPATTFRRLLAKHGLLPGQLRD